MKPLYFAPMNFFGNYVYRHFLLVRGVDYVLSELIQIPIFEKEIKKDKLEVFPEDIPKTIFQIGASNANEIVGGVKKLKELIPTIKEINLNMCCPQSSMKQKQICGGILYNKDLMEILCVSLENECKKQNIIPSIKIRLGTNKKNIEIKDYLEIAKKTGIKKVYVHTRPLCYSYNDPAMSEKLTKSQNIIVQKKKVKWFFI